MSLQAFLIFVKEGFNHRSGQAELIHTKYKGVVTISEEGV